MFNMGTMRNLDSDAAGNFLTIQGVSIHFLPMRDHGKYGSLRGLMVKLVQSMLAPVKQPSKIIKPVARWTWPILEQ